MNTGIVERAATLLGPDCATSLERIANLRNGAWYLREKIVNEPDWEIRHDNTRPLKYALYFTEGGGDVSFVKEGAVATPDLEVQAQGHLFYVEVKKLRMGGVLSQPAERFQHAAAGKRRQLPRGRIGVVAVDNFRIGLERGTGHPTIQEAASRLEKIAADHPEDWQQPSAVIYSAGSYVRSGGHAPFPYFLWLNPFCEAPMPGALTHWLIGLLPSCRVLVSSK